MRHADASASYCNTIATTCIYVLLINCNIVRVFALELRARARADTTATHINRFLHLLHYIALRLATNTVFCTNTMPIKYFTLACLTSPSCWWVSMSFLLHYAVLSYLWLCSRLYCWAMLNFSAFCFFEALSCNRPYTQLMARAILNPYHILWEWNIYTYILLCIIINNLRWSIISLSRFLHASGFTYYSYGPLVTQYTVY